MLLKSFYKGLAGLVILNVIIKTFWIFGVDAQVQIAVGNAAYGKYYSLLNFALMLNLLLDFGLSNYWLAHHDDTSKNISFVYQSKIIFSILYAITFLIIALVTNLTNSNLWLPIMLLQVGNSFIVFYRYILQQKELYITNNIFSILDRVIAGSILLLGLFAPLFFLSINVNTYAWVQAIAILVSNILIHVLFFPKKILVSKIDWSVLQAIIEKAAPFALLILFMTLLLRIDVFFIKHLHPSNYVEVAQYTYGFRFLDALNNFGFMIASFAFAFFCKNKLNKKVLQTVSTKLSLILLTGTCVLILVLVVGKDYFATILYKDTSIKTKQLMLLGAISFIGASLVHIYGSLLTASLQLKAMSILCFICLVIATLLHLSFTGNFGALAAAYITALVQFIFGLGCFALCKTKKII